MLFTVFELFLILFLTCQIEIGGWENTTSIIAKIFLLERDQEVESAAEDEQLFQDVPKVKGSLQVPLARLWWPQLMHPDPGYLYQLEV